MGLVDVRNLEVEDRCSNFWLLGLIEHQADTSTIEEGNVASGKQVKKPTMSRLVAAMRKDGLVNAAASKQDARSIQITPTGRGKALLLAGKKRRVESLAHAVAELSEGQIQQMEKTIDALQDL